MKYMQKTKETMEMQIDFAELTDFHGMLQCNVLNYYHDFIVMRNVTVKGTTYGLGLLFPKKSKAFFTNLTGALLSKEILLKQDHTELRPSDATDPKARRVIQYDLAPVTSIPKKCSPATVSNHDILKAINCWTWTTMGSVYLKNLI